MASFNSSFFLTLLVLISAFMAAPSSVEAQFPNLTSPGLFRASGRVPCGLNVANLSVNLPPFPNARVEMRCGGTTMANTTTNALGIFDLSFRSPSVMRFLTLLEECKVVVPTTLNNCDPSLPSVGLRADVIGFGFNLVDGAGVVVVVCSSSYFVGFTLPPTN